MALAEVGGELAEERKRSEALAGEKAEAEEERAKLSALLIDKTRLAEMLQKQLDERPVPSPTEEGPPEPSEPEPPPPPPPKRRSPGRLRGRTARYDTRLTSPIEELTSLSGAERAKRTERDLPVVIAAADPKLRDRCARELGETGISAVPLDEGKEVWQRVSQHRAKALVLDIDFGEEDAKGLVGWLALSKRALPVVADAG